MVSKQSTHEFDINAAFGQLMNSIGLSPMDTGGKITFTGSDPIFDSRFRIGASISIPIMAAAAGAAIVWRNRTGRGQDLSIDLRKAIHGVNPVYKFKPTINGFPYQSPAFSPIVSSGFVFDLFLTRDGRWVLPTGGYPHMINEWCSLLRCTPDKASIATAILKWDGKDLDDLAAERNMVFALCRSKEEWALHPQGELLASKPLVDIEKIADSEPEPFGPADRPLSGVRVMSATHVIAGNTVSRTLAEQGAEVLHIEHPQEFEHEIFTYDPCVGHRSCWLDLKSPDGNRRGHELAAGADVFVDSYRGRALSNLGFSPQELAERRPGTIYCSVRGYGYDGLWANRAGFDMEALCVSGFTKRPAIRGSTSGQVLSFLIADTSAALMLNCAAISSKLSLRSLTRVLIWLTSLLVSLGLPPPGFSTASLTGVSSIVVSGLACSICSTKFMNLLAIHSK